MPSIAVSCAPLAPLAVGDNTLTESHIRGSVILRVFFTVSIPGSEYELATLMAGPTTTCRKQANSSRAVKGWRRDNPVGES